MDDSSGARVTSRANQRLGAISAPLVLSAKSKKALARLRLETAAYLGDNPQLKAEDVSFTLLAGRDHFSFRLALVFEDPEDAAQQLAQAAVPEHVPTRKKGLQMVFPDLGGPPTDSSCLADHFAEMDACLASFPGFERAALSGARVRSGAQERVLWLCHQLAMFRRIQAGGYATPELVGLGFGQWVAAVAAGIFSFRELLPVVILLGEVADGNQSREVLRDALAKLNTDKARIPLVSGHRGTLVTAAEWADPDFWLTAGERGEHDPSPLLNKPGCLSLVLGPLSAMPARPGLEGRALLACVDDSGFCFESLVASLYLRGLCPDWARYFQGRPGRRIPLPTYSFDEKPYWFTPGKLKPAVAQAPPVPPAPQAEEQALDLAAMIEGLDEATLDRLLANYENADSPPKQEAAESAHERPELDTPYTAPRDPLEQEVAELCARLLHMEKVGVHDNIVHLGADSIFTMQLSKILDERYGVTLTPHHLFAEPNVASLARTLREERR